MVKGVSRRVIVIDAPDRRLFEQAIFIVRNDAVGEGVTAQALVEEARRVARRYAVTERRRFTRFRGPGPLTGALLGALSIGLVWLAVTCFT